MARKVWRFDLEDGPHVVELEHGYWTGRRVVRLDGETVVKVERNLLDMGGMDRFQVGSHECVLWIEANGLTYHYDLLVDRRSVESGALRETEHGTRFAEGQNRERVQADGFLLLVFAAYHGYFGPLHPVWGAVLGASGLALLLRPRREVHFHLAIALVVLSAILTLYGPASEQDTHFAIVQLLMAAISWYHCWSE